MAGLFTLNSATLGVLNTNALAGFGTGFVDGQSSSSGNVTGTKSFSGTVTGSTQSNGSAAGVVGYQGSASGLLASSGSAQGNAQRVGFVSGVTVSSGSVTGVENDQGLVTGVSNSNGVAAGNPALAGSIAGITVSTGSASGSPDAPPAPPEPESTGGGASYTYRLVHGQRPKKKDAIAQATHFTGKITGVTIGESIILGLVNNFGVVAGSTFSSAFVDGVRYPTDEIVARWNMQKLENELLTIGLL